MVADSRADARQELLVGRPRPSSSAVSRPLLAAIARLGATSAAVDHAPAAIVTVAADGVITTGNAAADALFGWPAGTAAGRVLPFTDRAGPLDVRGILGRLLDGHAVAPLRLELTDDQGEHDGETRQIVTSFTTSADDLVVFCADVTGFDPAGPAVEAVHHWWIRLLRHITETVTIVDSKGKIVGVEATLDDILGRTGSDYAEMDGFAMIHPDDLVRAGQTWARLLERPGAEAHEVFRMQHADGHFEQVAFGCVNLLDDPVINGVLLTTTNVTRQLADEALLASQSEVLELIARDSPLEQTLPTIAALVDAHTRGRSGILLLRADARGLEVGATGSLDPALLNLLRRAPLTPSPRLDTLDIRRPLVITDLVTDPRTSAIHEEATAHGMNSAWSVPIVGNRKDELLGVIAVFGTEHREPDDHEREVGAVASHLASIAIERTRALQQLEHQGSHDQVTGLPNRSSLLLALERVVERARERGTTVAVMFVDIDRFKAVNDTFGHAGGDTLLMRFGRRLRTLVRADDLLGNFGGDEFVIVTESADAAGDAQLIGSRIDLALSEPFALDEGEVFVSTSIGVAVSTGEETAELLLRHADVARSRAKELGRDRLEVFDQAMRQRSNDRLRIERELRLALDRDQLVLHYQPTVDVRTGRLVGAEALLRWNHPTEGLLLPPSFLEIAEGSGTILRVGRFVLDEALAQARRWVDADPALDTFTITINLSAREVSAPGLATQVRQALDRHRWPADQLVLDLTERILVEDRETALRTLQGLKRVGVRLAIDDFGTGFSSLSYLHRFPVDMVKIDPSFIMSLAADGSGSPVVSAVLHMADALGLVVLAEGVDEQRQLDGLRQLRCELAQGNLLGAPLPADEALTGRVG